MRTRFAPSPTGFLHVGGLRTALYAYLLARKAGGQFLLRIEDTDQARSVKGAVENIVRTLHWAGLDPDEGVMMNDGTIIEKGDKGPYTQSRRLDMYKEYARQLIASGHAYYAFDSAEEINQMKEQMMKDGFTSPNYNAAIRMRMKNSLSLTSQEVRDRLKRNDPYVVRFKIPENRKIAFKDEVRGKVEFDSKILDDQVLLKSDGFPTYHLAHVVDDHLMEINIVIRGEEWLSSLPKHLLLFEAFGWEPPQYAHVPLLLNKDRSKLSKRQSDVAAEDYIAKGYLPEALLNFLALLGWNPGTEKEVLSLQELIDAFSLGRVQKGGAIFDTEKLDWLQGQWMRRMAPDLFASQVKELVPAAKNDKDFAKKAALIQERVTFFHEAPSLLTYFYEEPVVTVALLANEKQKVTADMLPDILSLLTDTLSSISDKDWNEEHIKEALFAVCKKHNFKHGQLLWPLRALLTGQQFSAGAFEVAALFGKAKTLQRVGHASSIIS